MPATTDVKIPKRAFRDFDELTSLLLLPPLILLPEDFLKRLSEGFINPLVRNFRGPILFTSKGVT